MAAVTNTSFHSRPSDFRAQASLLDTISEGIIVRRGDNVLFANKSIMSMFGLGDQNASLIEQPVTEWIHPEDRHIVAEMYSKRVNGQFAPDEYNFRVIKVTGDVLWVACKAQVIDWNGQPAVAATFHDITAQKESADSEQFTKGLFKNIFNITPEFMVLFKLGTGKVIDANPAFLNIFGRRRDEVIGARFHGGTANNSFLDRYSCRNDNAR